MLLLFFFFKQKTAYEMRISDWSSDVCSSDLYVQQRMRERSRELFDWLENGAHVYVCGDASNLAPDVHEALIDVVASESRTGREAAEDYVRSLQADHRYQRDVY